MMSRFKSVYIDSVISWKRGRQERLRIICQTAYNIARPSTETQINVIVLLMAALWVHITYTARHPQVLTN